MNVFLSWRSRVDDVEFAMKLLVAMPIGAEILYHLGKWDSVTDRISCGYGEIIV